MTVSLERVRYDDPAAAGLVEASIEEMNGRYGGVPGSGPTPVAAEFDPPDGVFLLARLDGELAGCGGLSRLDPATAEIRRMYVAPEARGHGIAKEILGVLLEAAQAAGYERVRLETGERQPEAIGLYRGAGFEPIPCWGAFAGDPRSVCLELRLRAPG